MEDAETETSVSRYDSITDKLSECERVEDGSDADHTLNDTKEAVTKQEPVHQTEDASKTELELSPQVKIASLFLSIPHGLILRATYEHGKRHTEIMGVTYNERMRQFVILDAKGITTWKRDAVEARVHRAFCYPKYEYRLITHMLYAKKYNCYFILGKDFSLKVLNREFIETCSVSADLRSVLFMLFNPVRDELITGGVGGTKVWHFQQQPINVFGNLKTHTSYVLVLRYELPNVGGSWVKRVQLDHHLGHMYFCSDHNLFIYDLEGRLLHKFERAHSMSITGCRYSSNASVLVTSSLDSEVKVWSLIGGLVHTFRGHSRAVTNLILHPMTSSIVITCSLDGTIRMLSLDTMDCLYSLVVSVDGIQWMGLTDDNLLYLSTARALTLWSLNYTEQFWALARSQVTRMTRCGCKGKTTRILAISEDSSVRLMSRSNGKCLTTVLPPPNISPLQKVVSVCCSREFNTVYMLVNSHEIWVYTARTDPACRIAVWHVVDIQRCFPAIYSGTAAPKVHKQIISLDKTAEQHKPPQNGVGNEGLVRCNCTTVLTSAVVIWTNKSYCCPIRDSFLLVGLEDGRILFMDPIIKGRKFWEFKTGNDPVLNMHHDVANNELVTLHKLKGMTKIVLWHLPDLVLQHEIYTAPDVRDFARESNILVTGHESGCIFFHTLGPVDPSYKGRALSAYREKVKVNHKPEHQAPVIAVDVCVAIKLFCSCSEDGTIKMWYDKVLLTEIVLDASLSAACFLNSRGDLLVGYQKHVFCIDHSKVCPQLATNESDVENCDKESYICEDPYVFYEGVTQNRDQVTLENYLVPFDIDISKDFLEGRVTLEPEAKKKEVSDEENESQISVVPTEIYSSPESTPQKRLSLVDLILSSEVNNNDLLTHMKKLLDHIAEKEKRDAAQLLYEQQTEQENKALMWQVKKRGRLIDSKSEKVNLGRDRRKHHKREVEKQRDIIFCFPRIGKSPGPSPEDSAATTPEPFSESEEELEELDITLDEVDVQTQEQRQSMEVVRVEDDEANTFVESEDKEMPEVKAPTETFTSKTRFGFSHIKVDAQTLMTDTKKSTAVAVVPKRRPDPDQTQVQVVHETGSEKTFASRQTPTKKKMMTASQRRSTKSNLLDDVGSRDEPATHIQTFELKEQEPSFPRSSSLAGDNDLHNVMEDTEASFQTDNEYNSKTSSVSNLTEASIESEEISTPEISVPDLPCVPVAISSQDFSRPLISKVNSAKSRHTIMHPVTSFSSHSNIQEGRSELDVSEVTVYRSNKDDNSKSLNPLTTFQMDYVALESEGSQDAASASRAGLLFEDPTGGTLQERASSVTEAADLKSQTPALIEEHSYTKPLNGIFSNHLQATLTVPHFEHSDGEEPHFKYESLSEPQEDFDQSESGSFDSSWVDRGFILDTQHLKAHDHDLGQTGDLAEHTETRNDLTSQEHGEDKEASLERTKSAAMRPTFPDNGVIDKPENVARYFKQRPHTTRIRSSREELLAVFDASMTKYKTILRVSYEKGDRTYSENWHEREIERHLLTRMQKELREQNVLKKRQMMTQARQENRKQHVTEDIAAAANRESSFGHVLFNTNQRASTVHGNRPVINIPRPTPTATRPHTSTGVCCQYPLQLENQAKPQQSLTIQQLKQQTRNIQTRLQKINQEKAELKSEKPFRCRLRQQQAPQRDEVQRNSDKPLVVNPRLLDPRNPQAVRPKSSKSIPSKCHHFVLVNKPKTVEDFPIPTSLEKCLLALRFPQDGERIFRRTEKLLLSRSFYPPDSRADFSSSYQGQLFG